LCTSAIPEGGQSATQFRWRELQHFSPAFWFVCFIVLFSRWRVSAKRSWFCGKQSRLDNDYVPLVWSLMNAVYAVSSYPAGHLSDRVTAAWYWQPAELR